VIESFYVDQTRNAMNAAFATGNAAARTLEERLNCVAADVEDLPGGQKLAEEICNVVRGLRTVRHQTENAVRAYPSPRACEKCQTVAVVYNHRTLDYRCMTCNTEARD
jgi:hypothetical protein